VGYERSDDAAVYRLSDELAVISTVDFITPPVDDPVWFGRIAAANSLSDIYAMGGRPVTALNVVMFPSKKLGTEILKGILEGGHEKVIEAGACLAGGHSVDDEEPKYGLAVTGVVHPKRILTNSGAQPDDVLILSKPIGTGVLFNANRAGKLPWRELEQILPAIAALNRTALDVALKHEIHSCTDITGFGIIGHALEMSRGSAVRIDLDFSALPFYPNSLEMYRKGVTTGSNSAIRKHVEKSLHLCIDLDHHEREILFDPQTSGGLLFAVPETHGESLVHDLRAAGVADATLIGRAASGQEPGIRLL